MGLREDIREHKESHAFNRLETLDTSSASWATVNDVWTRMAEGQAPVLTGLDAILEHLDVADPLVDEMLGRTVWP